MSVYELKPKPSFLACHLLGQITKASATDSIAVQFPFTEEDANVASKAGLPDAVDLLNEINDIVIAVKQDDGRVSQFRVIEAWSLDDELITVRLTQEFVAWPGRIEFVQIHDAASATVMLH